MKRLILSHTLHPKMLRKNIQSLTIIKSTDFEISELFRNAMEEERSFLNAFANQKKLSIVQANLSDFIEYSKVLDLELEFDDILIVPVIFDDRVQYWLKIIMWDRQA